MPGTQYTALKMTSASPMTHSPLKCSMSSHLVLHEASHTLRWLTPVCWVAWSSFSLNICFGIASNTSGDPIFYLPARCLNSSPSACCVFNLSCTQWRRTTNGVVLRWSAAAGVQPFVLFSWRSKLVHINNANLPGIFISCHIWKVMLAIRHPTSVRYHMEVCNCFPGFLLGPVVAEYTKMLLIANSLR